MPLRYEDAVVTCQPNPISGISSSNHLEAFRVIPFQALCKYTTTIFRKYATTTELEVMQPQSWLDLIIP